MNVEYIFIVLALTALSFAIIVTMLSYIFEHIKPRQEETKRDLYSNSYWDALIADADKLKYIATINSSDGDIPYKLFGYGQMPKSDMLDKNDVDIFYDYRYLVFLNTADNTTFMGLSPWNESCLIMLSSFNKDKSKELANILSERCK